MFFVTRGLLSDILFVAFITYACTVPTRSNTTGPIEESSGDCIRKKTVINAINKPAYLQFIKHEKNSVWYRSYSPEKDFKKNQMVLKRCQFQTSGAFHEFYLWQALLLLKGAVSLTRLLSS